MGLSPSIGGITNPFFDFHMKNVIFPSAFAFSHFGIKSHLDTASFFLKYQIYLFNDKSCISTTKKPWPYDFNLFQNSPSKEKKEIAAKEKMYVPKVAIIGGGLCGVTAAKALVSRMKAKGFDKDIDITIFESDLKYLNDDEVYSNGSECIEDNGKPKWKAAAARNANSLVPGASMHIMSQRNTIGQILKDYFGMKQPAVFTRSPSEEDNDFSTVPPYFGFSANRCMGFSASWEERFSFFIFMYHFLKTSIFSTETNVKLRGKYLVQLAHSNQLALSRDLNAFSLRQNTSYPIKAIDIGSGFIAVYRSKEKAESAVKEAETFGQTAELLSFESAQELEPRVKFLPFKEAYFVHRPNDQTGNCYQFMLSSIKSLIEDGVKYEKKNGNVIDIQRNDVDVGAGRFRVITSHCCHEYDYVILANGIFTPMMARKIGLRTSFACPIYPLKGYSMTLYNNAISSMETGSNFLKKALSFDNLYCTSVCHNMVRLAGFGELMGYPSNEDDYRKAPAIPTNVLWKYATAIFGNDFNCQPSLVTPCYRPLSPDDLPLVGEVKSCKGLFLHTGHGTLGWTLCLATADCLAQSIFDEIKGNSETNDSFTLPDGTSIAKSVLSPNRFLL